MARSTSTRAKSKPETKAEEVVEATPQVEETKEEAVAVAKEAPVVEEVSTKSSGEKMVKVKVIYGFNTFYGNRRFKVPASDKTVELPETLATMLEKVNKVIIK